MARRKANVAELDLSGKLDVVDPKAIVDTVVEKQLSKVYCEADFQDETLEVENLQTKKRYTVTVGHFIKYQQLLKLCK